LKLLPKCPLIRATAGERHTKGNETDEVLRSLLNVAVRKTGCSQRAQRCRREIWSFVACTACSAYTTVSEDGR
jgi:hypothetical protein